MIDYKAYFKPDLERRELLPFFTKEFDDELYFAMEKDERFRYIVSWVFVDDEWIICQFTNTLDKNGDKIYQKDIVIWSGESPQGWEFKHVCEVEWSHEFCGWSLKGIDDATSGLKNVPIGFHGAKPYELLIDKKYDQINQLLQGAKK